jgi:ATP-dependent protease ClpP protease subunit
MERDNFMSAEQAVAYGLADKVLEKRITNSVAE